MDQIAPVEGGIYICTSSKPFNVIKVLKFEEEIVHIAMYKNTYSEIPRRVLRDELVFGTIHDKDGFGISHMPISYSRFAAMKPQFLQHSLVVKEELEGYNIWKENNGGVWS